MRALILAAGFGTRLAPYTRSLPKALFPISGTPVLGKMIASLKRAGCHAIAVNTHHLADRIRSYLAETDFGIPIRESYETEILGTGGAIRRLAHFWADEPFIVVNADIVTDIDLAAVYRGHLRSDVPVTLVMHDRPPFNQVGVDANDRITGFARIGGEGSGGHREMAFTGIHVLDPRVLRWIPEGKFSDIVFVYQQMIDGGIPIRAHRVTNHYWQDMGRPDRFRTAVMDAMAPGVFRSVFPGDPAHPIRCTPITGDGSDRNWFRLAAGPNRMIAADHGITLTLAGSELNAFVAIGNHLHQCGIPAPRIHAHDGFSGLVFLEDLGDCHLQQVVQRARRFEAIEPLYRTIIDALMDLSAKAREGFDPAWTCQSRSYDENLILEKECRYFVDAFAKGYLELSLEYEELAAEFADLAGSTLAVGTDGLIHRDLQSRNIMVREGRFYFIDFQGARFGPVQYDLASLIIDPYVGLPATGRRRLLAYATRQAAQRLAADPDRFVDGFHHCAVTRNLQMLGAFGFLSRVKNKSAFARWIPAAARMLPGHIQDLGADRFPRLMAIAKRIAMGYKNGN